MRQVLLIAIVCFSSVFIVARECTAATTGDGWSALAGKDYSLARDEFVLVVARDPKNVDAKVGLGVAYIGLKQFEKATPLFNKVLLLNHSDRVAAYDNAVAFFDLKNTVRSAKLITDYLQAHPKETDEPLANALAIVLNQASEATRKGSTYQTEAAFYKTYNARLEAAAPGMKRWGIDWYSDADYQKLLADITDKQKIADDRHAAIAKIQVDIDGLNAQIAVVKPRVETQREPQSSLDHLTGRVGEKTDEKEKVQKEYESALADVPQPSLPTTIDPYTPKDMPPAALIGSAGPDSSSSPEIVKRSTHTISTPGGGSNDDPPITVKGQHAAAPDAPDAADGVTPKPALPAAPSTEYAAAFAVAPNLLVTSAAVVTSATKVELMRSDGTSLLAEIVRSDATTGLALLRIPTLQSKYLSLATAFAGGDVQCADFPSSDIFNPAAELIDGTAPAPASSWQIQLKRQPRLPGAAVIVGGKIIGVQMDGPDASMTHLSAVTLESLRTFLGADRPNKPGDGDAIAVTLLVSATR